MFPVIILAGGIGSRLYPFTKTKPKALVEVAGKPFVEWQLMDLCRNGVRDVIFAVSYRATQIEAVVQKLALPDMTVSFIEDGDQRLGTGGATMKALKAVGVPSFVIYGDTLLDIDFEDFQQAFESSSRPAAMSIIKNDNKWDRSNVVYAGGDLTLYDKQNQTSEMSYIDYGASIYDPTFFDDYFENTASPEASFDLGDALLWGSKNQKITPYEVFNRFYEIGTIESLKEVENFLTGDTKIGFHRKLLG